jgi:hypothetical protein
VINIVRSTTSGSALRKAGGRLGGNHSRSAPLDNEAAESRAQFLMFSDLAFLDKRDVDRFSKKDWIFLQQAAARI